MNTNILLCTATQPALDDVKSPLAIPKNSEIIKNFPEVMKAFKRVEVYNQIEKIGTEELTKSIIEKSSRFNNQLIILNTKRAVRNLYETLKQENLNTNLYHLSTSMCPAHRKSILTTIKNHLASNEKVICVSTQLIEAGVDISFESVTRSLAGLDSIAQAAGRCNRHGEKEKGFVYLINHKEENLDKLPEILKGKEITQEMLRDLEMDSSLWDGELLSNHAMRRYFERFYRSQGNSLDGEIHGMRETHFDLLLSIGNRPNVYSRFKAECEKDYPLVFTNRMNTSARNFEVIPNQTRSVLVPYSEGNEIISELISNQYYKDLSVLLKKAQQYSLNIFDYEYKLLEKEGGLISTESDGVVMLKEGFYSKEYGLALDGNADLGLLAF